MSDELKIALLAFVLSAMYSGSEAVFYSAHRIKIEILKKKKVRGAEWVSQYLNHPERYLSTILVGNNIATVLFGSYAAIYLSQFCNGLVSAIISTSFLLFFAEILPKSLLRVAAEPALLRMVYWVRFSELLFLPATRFFSFLAKKLLSTFASGELKTEGAVLSKDDIRFLFRESRYLGHINLEDEEFVRRIMKLGSAKARQIMVPRTEIEAIPVSTTLGELQHRFMSSQYSRIPVYEKTVDQIIGVVFALDFFKFPQNIKDILRPVPFVPETKSVLSLMRALRIQKSSIAIVIDEYGGTAGLVTLEDIFEEIFGEIADEYDEEEPGIRKLASTEFMVRARVELDVVNRELNLDLPGGEYDTLAGLIIHKLGYIPGPGETINLPKCQIIIAQSDRTKINSVKIIKK